MRHQAPISKAQKRDLINKVQGKSGRETEQLLSNTFPLICSEREKVRDISNDKVEIKVILNKESQQKLDTLKKLLSHKNPNMSYGELISLLAEMGLNKYDPKRKIKKQSLKTPTKKQAVKVTKKSLESFLEPSGDSSEPSRDTTNTKNLEGFHRAEQILWKTACGFSKGRVKSKSVTTSAEIRANTKIKEPKKVFNKIPRKTSVSAIKQKLNNNQKHLKHTKYIPSVVRHHVWMRDQGQCTYVCSKTKRRCSSNHLLQIDHIKAFSRGGTNEPDNLRLLCANHNQFTFSRYQKFL